ncbi:MAG: Gfo/Idh/MocA family oxidoreductase [Saprospiraceae bacterium]|nr:Gfo/Idh/MocA family oxidoreductase [Candidatus Opimibacter iunctus]
MKSGSSRRKFVQTSALAAAGFMVIPRHVLGRGFKSPSDKLNIAFVGCGGRGGDHVNTLKGENLVAFCDVDDKRAAEAYEAFPNVARFKDYRKMFDAMSNQIDAVVVATPDHMHALPALAAMQLGKHVYVEKPLTHNIGEARQLLEASRKYKVVTQMGNQGASMDCNAQLAEWVQGGVIGDVHTAHVWTNRPVWPQGVPTPVAKKDVPNTLDWNLWLGPAPYRAYDPAYLPFKWRGWWDFGTGALGDMGCHLLDPAYRALKLTSPLSAEASCTTSWVSDFVEANYADSCPPGSIVKLEFGPRKKMPACTLMWYDGGLRPMRPAELGSDEQFGSWDGGILLEGTKGKILAGIYGDKATLLPTSKMENFKAPKPSLPRYTGEHQTIWAEACKGNGNSSSPFEYAVPLTETLLMGNLAVRCYDYKVLQEGKTPQSWAPWNHPGRVRLDWDSANMRVTNYEGANRFISRESRAF